MSGRNIARVKSQYNATWLSILVDTRKNYQKLTWNTWSSYTDVRENMGFFKDVTGVIRDLQHIDARAVCLLCPPRFGKSLLLNIIEKYYNIREAQRFELHFKVYCVCLNNTADITTTISLGNKGP